MLLSQIKNNILYRLSQDRLIPDDNVLSSFIYESMYYVCFRCNPSELIRNSNDTTDYPLRFLYGGNFIAIPEYPNFEEDKHLQIDENLTFAVINYTVFLLSNNPMYKQLADETINEHISKEGIENYGYYTN